MKLRVFCSFRVGVRLEATGVRAECRCHLSPPPPLCGQICGEFLISQALGCLHTSQPQASQEALPVGGKEGGRDVLSCPGHSLAFATLSFLQPPSPSSWGLRAGNRTHTSGASQDSGVPTDLSIPGEGEVAEDWSWRVSSHGLSAAASRLPDSQAGLEAGLGSPGGCLQGAVPGALVMSHPSTGMFEVLLNSLLEFLCLLGEP